MGYFALLCCPDEKVARVVGQVFGDLDFEVEAAHEPFAAVKKMMSRHFDAIVVDCQDEQNASLLLKSARNSASNQSSLAIALVEGQAGVAKAYRIGANLVLTKPINLEQAKGTLRVARGLLRKNSDPRVAGIGVGAATGIGTGPGAGSDSGSAQFPPPATVLPAIWHYPTAIAPEPAVALATMSVTGSAAAAAPAKEKASAWFSPVESVVEDEDEDEDEGEREGDGEGLTVAETDVEPITAVVAESRLGETRARETGFALAVGGRSESPVTASSEVVVAGPQADAPENSSFPFETSFFEGLEEDSYGQASERPTAHTEALGPRRARRILSGAAVLAFAALAYVAYGKYAQSGNIIETPSGFSGPQDRRAYPSAEAASAPASGYASSLVPANPSALAVSSPASRIAKAGPTDLYSDPDPHPSETGAGAPSSAQAAAAPSGLARIAGAPIAIDLDMGSPSDSTSRNPTSAPAVVQSKPAPPAAFRVRSDENESAPPAVSMPTASAPGSGSLSSVLSSVSVARPTLATLKISQGVSNGLLIKRVNPRYPRVALATHAQGDVEIEATIDRQGHVANPKVLNGDPTFARAAVEAVRQWRYKPYYLDGQPVEVQTRIAIAFKTE